jgi:vitamin B12 transporter
MPTPRSILSIASVGLSLISVQASASPSPSASPDSTDSQPVIVSATTIPTPASQVASSVTVITGDEIEARQERTLVDVLKTTPGLNIVQTGGPGGQTSVFMRGTNSDHTKVFIDGIDVSDPSNPNASFDYSQLLTDDIERVEVLRGPQSGLYGSDAVGGVINITTYSGNGPAQLRAGIEGGSFDTFNQGINLRGQADQFHYSANLEHYHSGSMPVTPLNLLAPGERRNNDYYDNLTASTKLGLDINSNLDLGLVARYTNGHLRFTGDEFREDFSSFPAPRQSAASTSEAYTRVFGHLVVLDGFLDQTFAVNYTHKRTANYAPDSDVGLDTGSRIKFDYRAKLKFSETETLVLGAEHSRDEISEPLSASTKISSGYGELQSQLWGNFSSAVNVRFDDNSRFGSKATYRFAPTYLIGQTGTRVKASVGTGFKAPTLSELFQDFPPFFFANPNLKPETDLGWDLGLEQSILADKLAAGVTYFHIHLNDLIATAASGITYDNVGKATTQGIESFVDYKPFSTLDLRANYTYTEATDDVLHQELLRRPKHKVGIDASWQALSQLSVDASLLTVTSWVDGNRNFSIPRLNVPPYTTLDLAANYDLIEKLKVFARVTNLFDRHYQTPTGFLAPGRGAYAGVKVTL